MHIAKIENGILRLKNSKLYYDFRINSNDEFQIYSIFENKDIVASIVFKDRYGNVFVNNSTLNYNDEENRIIFYTKGVYWLSDQGIAVYLSTLFNINQIKVVDENGNRRNVLQSDKLTFSRNMFSFVGGAENTPWDNSIGYLENNEFSFTWIKSGKAQIIIYNTDTLECYDFYVGSDLADRAIYFNKDIILIYSDR